MKIKPLSTKRPTKKQLEKLSKKVTKECNKQLKMIRKFEEQSRNNIAKSTIRFGYAV